MSHLYIRYKLHFDISMSSRKQTHPTCVGVLVCMKDDLSSFPTCIFCMDIMPLFSIHKDTSGYPTWLLDEERHLQNSTQLKSLILQVEFVYAFFSFVKKNAVSGLQCLYG